MIYKALGLRLGPYVPSIISMPIILPLWRQRREEEKFKIILSKRITLRPAWATEILP